MKTLSDEPICDEKDDILKRDSFVLNLADSILSWNKEKSLVIGLYGKWGVGKTSILNLTEKKLKEEKEKIEIVKFNPWGYSESDDLLTPFITQISSQISKTKENKKILKLLKKYSDFIRILPTKDTATKTWSYIMIIFEFFGINIFNRFPNFIPRFKYWILFGFAILSVFFFFSETIINFIGFFKKNESLLELKKSINDKLSKSKKMVIIIDDIDRLSEKEMRQIFRIVKNNADFKNTIYVLSFDRDVVEKAITIENKLNGRDFLEKIVNVEYDLTEPPHHLLKSYFFDNLNKLIEPLNEEDKICFSDDRNKWSSIFNQIFYNLNTIREIKRYINLLSFKLNQFINRRTLEINLIDYFAIEFIRLKFPEYHKFIHENQVYFLTSKDGLNYKLASPNTESDKWFDKSIANYSREEQICLSELIVWLFPNCRYAINSYYKILAAGFNIGEPDRKKYICSETFFPIYFEHLPGITDNSVTQYDINRLKESSKNYESIYNILVEYIKNNKIQNLLRLIDSNVRDPMFLNNEQSKYFLLALFNLVDSIPDTPELLANKIYQVFSIGTLLLCNFDKNTSTDIVFYLLDNCLDIYYPCHFADRLIVAIEKNQESVIDVNKKEELKNLIISKIRSDENLLYNKHYSILMSIWKEFDAQGYENYEHKLIDSDEKLANLFDALITTGTMQTGISVSYYYSFNYKLLSEFGDLDDFKAKALSFKTIPSIYQKHKKSIDLFISNFDKKNGDQLPF